MSFRAVFIAITISTALVIAVALGTLAPLFGCRQSDTVGGRDKQEWLRVLGTGPETNETLLTLRPLGGEPGFQNFEVSISYDLLTNMPQGTWGRVGLCTDGKGETFAERSTNGNCRLEWDVIYARPGTHQLRAQLLIGGRGAPKPIEVLGPQRLLPSTNTFWLEPFYNAFSNSRGAVLHANIAGSNASYSVALFDMRGNHIRTFQGNLADNTLDIHWDLTDSEGRTVPDKDVNAVYSIEVPGRSRQVQTQQITRTFP